MRRRAVQCHAVDAREFFPQTSYLRRTVRAQTRECGCQSSAAIFGGLIDPLAIARGTDTLAIARGTDTLAIARGTDTLAIARGTGTLAIARGTGTLAIARG